MPIGVSSFSDFVEYSSNADRYAILAIAAHDELWQARKARNQARIEAGQEPLTMTHAGNVKTLWTNFLEPFATFEGYPGRLVLDFSESGRVSGKMDFDNFDIVNDYIGALGDYLVMQRDLRALQEERDAERAEREHQNPADPKGKGRADAAAATRAQIKVEVADVTALTDNAAAEGAESNPAAPSAPHTAHRPTRGSIRGASGAPATGVMRAHPPSTRVQIPQSPVQQIQQGAHAPSTSASGVARTPTIPNIQVSQYQNQQMRQAENAMNLRRLSDGSLLSSLLANTSVRADDIGTVTETYTITRPTPSGLLETTTYSTTRALSSPDAAIPVPNVTRSTDARRQPGPAPLGGTPVPTRSQEGNIRPQSVSFQRQASPKRARRDEGSGADDDDAIPPSPNTARARRRRGTQASPVLSTVPLRTSAAEVPRMAGAVRRRAESADDDAGHLERMGVPQAAAAVLIPPQPPVSNRSAEPMEGLDDPPDF